MPWLERLYFYLKDKNRFWSLHSEYLSIFMLSISCIKYWTLVLFPQAIGQPYPFSPHLHTMKVTLFSS